MAETMKLQIVKCPACNQALTSFSAFKSTVTCPRCGSVIKNPLVTAKEEMRPERFIPFSTQESDFERSMINALINQDYVPKTYLRPLIPTMYSVLICLCTSMKELIRLHGVVNHLI